MTHPIYEKGNKPLFFFDIVDLFVKRLGRIGLHIYVEVLSGEMVQTVNKNFHFQTNTFVLC